MTDSELVLQFRGPRVETEDELGEIEDALEELLVDDEAWTGHEVTALARYIVIATSDGPATFARLLPFLESAGLAEGLAAVVIGPEGGAGTSLWPPGLSPTAT